MKTFAMRFGMLTTHFNETKIPLKTILKSLQNILNAFGSIENAFQRMQKSIQENNFADAF